MRPGRSAVLLLAAVFAVACAVDIPDMAQHHGYPLGGGGQMTSVDMAASGFVPHEGEHVVQDHSFQPPLLALWWASPWAKRWEFGLDAVVTDDKVRLTPSKQSREGYMWNYSPNRLPSWRLQVKVRLHNPVGGGGDGLAIWYRDQPSIQGGPLWGSADHLFRGLGVILDPYDNDNHRDNPAVHVIVGDGHKTFNTGNDVRDDKLGGCQFHFQNTAVVVDIEYHKGLLSVSIRSATAAAVGTAPTVCVADVPVELPTEYYFGMTAHTGALADAHDVEYFIVSTREAFHEDEEGGVYNGGNDDGGASFDHGRDRMEKERWKPQPEAPEADEDPVIVAQEGRAAAPPHSAGAAGGGAYHNDRQEQHHRQQYHHNEYRDNQRHGGV